MLASLAESVALDVSVSAVRSVEPAGRHQQFEQLVSCHLPALTRTAFRICASRESAEDVVQETLLRAWQYLDRLQDPKAVKAWLFAILRNERARSFSRSPRNHSDVDVDTLPALKTEPDLDTHRMRSRLGTMPEKYRLPLVLYSYQGFRVCEIADLLGIPQATVKTRLFRAREKLREAMSDVAVGEVG